MKSGGLDVFPLNNRCCSHMFSISGCVNITQTINKKINPHPEKLTVHKKEIGYKH